MNIVLKWINEIKYLLWLNAVRDALWNFWAYFIVIFCWIITSSLLAKNITPDELWFIWLIMTIIWIIASFIWFWYFEWYWLTLINENNTKKQAEIIWSWIIILLILIWIFFLITIFFLPIIYLIYKDISIIKTLTVINFVSCFSISSIFITITTRSIWKMKWQALYSLFYPILYLIWLVLLLNLKYLNVNYILIINYLALVTWLLIFILKFKPKYINFKSNYKKIKKLQKSQWIHKYIWQSFERSTYQLDKFIIWIFSYSNIAYYSLWLVLVSPISAFSSKLTDSLLKDFNKREKLTIKIFIYNFIWWFFCSIVLLLIAKSLILFLWTEQYLIILDFLYLILLISLTEIFYYILFSFLSLKSINQKLKKYFFIRGWTNLFGNLLLIPILWIKWALFATILWNILFLFWIYFEYLKLTWKKS